MFISEIVPTDRGVFIVKTQSSTHRWTITDESVIVERNPDADREHHWSMDGFPPSYHATPKAWPVVGECFLNTVNGGAGDIPWTRSSTVKSIERVS